MRRTLLISPLLIIAVIALSFAQSVPKGKTEKITQETTFKGCAPKGTPVDAELNMRKNRSDEGEYIAVDFAVSL